MSTGLGKQLSFTDSFIEIDKGPKTENKCLCAVAVGFRQLFKLQQRASIGHFCWYVGSSFRRSVGLCIQVWTIFYRSLLCTCACYYKEDD